MPPPMPAEFGMPAHAFQAPPAPLLPPQQVRAAAAPPGQPDYYFLDQRHGAAQARPAAPTGAAAAAPTARRFDTRGMLRQSAMDNFSPDRVRRDFPLLEERINRRPLIWLDNAATTQKPRCVIERLRYFYEHENSNVHRAAHAMAARATDAYEGARETVRGFLNAAAANEIVFVRGATEAINLVAQSWGRQEIGQDDEIVVSALEHHANIVPWQQLCAQTGAKLRVIPVDDDGQVLMAEYAALLNRRTRLVSFAHVSNALGTVTPAQEMVAMAHACGAKVLIDGAQAVSHMAVDVRALDCDWYVFSGHKVFGPTGIGVLYGREALLNACAPWQGGGNMIEDVTFEHTRYHPAPARFEAGTGNIAGAAGLAAALDYVSRIGMAHISHYEHGLLVYATAQLQRIPGLRMIGTAPDKASVLSFVLDGHEPAAVGTALNDDGIAVRAGHHCAQPILRRFGLEGTVRASLAFYNNTADVDALVASVRRVAMGRAAGAR
jgi:cysteine desulfurase/selenocysteine lyase